MKLASKERYLIFVRPPGSRMWTQHMKAKGVPYVSFNPDQAFQEACNISEKGQYCTQVCKVELRPEIDTVLKATTHDLDKTYLVSSINH